MTEYPPQELLDNRSDPDVRAVLDDWHRERGIPRTPLGVAISAAAADAAAADDADAADDAAAAAADDADAAADAADADADDAADAAADDAADDDAAADDAADRGIHLFQLKDTDMMRDGLFLVRLRGGWYGRGVPVIGWMRRHGGDWWHILPGARVVTRTNGDMTSLSVLADSGPTRNHRMRPASTAVEIVNVLGMLRIFEADETAWAEHCPRPVDWKGES